VSRSHEMTTVRLWERTQRVSDDTTDLLHAYLSETSGRLSKGQLFEVFPARPQQEPSHSSVSVRLLL
jgi:hypothetical protein